MDRKLLKLRTVKLKKWHGRVGQEPQTIVFSRGLYLSGWSSWTWLMAVSLAYRIGWINKWASFKKLFYLYLFILMAGLINGGLSL